MVERGVPAPSRDGITLLTDHYQPTGTLGAPR
ncbi:putative acyl esterase [Amycolatopsis jiangsuensis]|uniref:Putative acyl esterase n=1 Tax=Amycolatopsis jiangsuensis TaxID=1181879 RepID=A0A840ILN2_9PSEU|nr:putative acyl esterase [Amycolatopsis jiangsuensis]